MRRGLGSSASAIVGGLVAANYLAGEPFKREELLAFTMQMEHHPDNLAPCLLGGCRVVVVDGGVPIARAVPLPEGLGVVLYVPEFEIPTPVARAVLPGMVPIKDAIFNAGRVALLVNALATGSLDDLRVATQDRLHQPARSVLFPAMNDIFKAALDGGAKGVFLSGSGSTIMALTRGSEETVGQEMAEAARKAGVPGKVVITRPCLAGAHIVKD
jgi:homoserine kinase